MHLTESHEPLVSQFFEDSFSPDDAETTSVCTVPTYIHFKKDLIPMNKNKRILCKMLMKYFTRKVRISYLQYIIVLT